jgi:hypothetical protein
MTALTDPLDIQNFRILTLRQALKLEIKGIKRRGRSAYAILKEMGYTGTRQQVLDQLDEFRDELLQNTEKLV